MLSNKILSRESFITTAKVSLISFAFTLPLSTTVSTIFFYFSAFFALLFVPFRMHLSFLSQIKTAQLFLLLFLLLCIGVFYSSAPWQQALAMLSKYDKFLLSVLFLALLTENKWRRMTINGFVIATLLSIFLIYLIDFKLANFQNRYTVGGGLFKDYIQTSFLANITFYILAYRFLFEKTNRYHWFYLLALPFLIYYITFISAGRTGYVVFCLIILLLCWQRFRFKGLILGAVLAILCMGLAGLHSKEFQSRVNEAYSNLQTYHHEKSTSVGYRLSFAHESLQLIKQHPIFGTGTGSLAYEVAHMQPQPIALTRNPHNEYLNITVQLGLIGLLVLLLMYYYCIYEARLLPLEMQHFARAITLVIMLGSCFNSWLMDTTEGHFFCVFLMLAFASQLEGSGQRR